MRCSMRRWNGLADSTIGGCSNRPATCRRRVRTAITVLCCGRGACCPGWRVNAIRAGLRMARACHAEPVAPALDAGVVEQLAGRVATGARKRTGIGPLHVRGDLFGRSLRCA